MKERSIRQTKEFMRRFLTTELFDEWLLGEAMITGAVTWTVDGRVNRAYYGEDADAEAPGSAHMPWAQIRPIVLSLIRGNTRRFLSAFSCTRRRIRGIRRQDRRILSASAGFGFTRGIS